MTNIIVLAPGHNETDRRVNRTLGIMKKKFDKVAIMYEKRLSTKPNNIQNTEIDYFYLENTKPYLKVIPRLRKYYIFIKDIASKYNVIYIHDSGILGLLLAKKIKTKHPKCKVIFDYHDYVQWETYYQTSKIFKSLRINKLINSMVLYAFQYLLKKRALFDGLVGISDSQIRSLLDFLAPSKKPLLLTIPNTRNKLVLVEQKPTTLGTPCFLWVGNISKGRDLETIVTFLDKFDKENTMSFKFKVIGHIKSEELFNALQTKPYFTYAGTFLGDKDIHTKLDNDMNIGVFMGWNDALNVKINEIASPNKVYSYINIGLPIIYNSKLTDLHSILGDSAGITAENYEDFVKAANTILEGYSTYVDNVYKMRNELQWDTDIIIKIESFLENFIERNGNDK